MNPRQSRNDGPHEMIMRRVGLVFACCMALSPSNSIGVRMANPSSRHDHNERERRHRSDRHSLSSHHHRTISSTTLLLVLSLILAVLALMLSFGSNQLQLSRMLPLKMFGDTSPPSDLRHQSLVRAQLLLVKRR
jgi:hypothetical protein